VVHAAMVLDDAMLEHLDPVRLRAVLAPKVAGGWNLHQLTRELELDHFVMLSSCSAVLGPPSQAGYAAANAFLDALAAHRRALGLPALALDLGPIAGAGHVARHPEVQRLLARSGLTSVPVGEAWALLEASLHQDVDRVILADLDAGARGAGGAIVREALGHALAASGQATAPSADGNGAPSAWDGDDGKGPAGLERRLVARAARILDASPERIDPDRPLVELGLDSLMAAELVTAMQRDLDVSVSLGEILEGASLRELAALVSARTASPAHA
jgi:phthiocerol/phenolphthiocerol synthesis type-I polyketide synthase C